MIQRIQTVYLALVVIALGLLFAFPLAQFFGENGAYVFSILGLKNMVPGGTVALPALFFLPMPIIAGIVAIISIWAIFKYKNRAYQLKITHVGVFLLVLLICGIFFLYIPMIEKRVNIVPDYTKAFGVYLPLIALVFMVLANRAIRRDERLVRSADRLR